MYKFVHITTMRAWLLALAMQCASGNGASVPCWEGEDRVTMHSSFSRQDTRFDPTDEHTFTINNGHTVTVTGFDSTRAVGYGFRCFEGCRLGDEKDRALATVSGLWPEGRYRFRLWQVSQPEEQMGGYWKNELYVNGDRYDTTMGFDTAAYGYATATVEGTVEFLFVNTNEFRQMGLSWVSLAEMCGCSFDEECPGGELCEGSEEDIDCGDGVCTLGAECAPTDHRAAEYSCLYMAGAGVYAGNAWCGAWPNQSAPKFTPMEMCCECSAGLSWVKTPYQLDDGGYKWRDFGGVKAEDSTGKVVLEVGAGHRVRGVMVDGAPGRKTPKTISASAGSTQQGPWTQLATWRQEEYERVWTDFSTEQPFLQLSWKETYGSTESKIKKISLKLGDRAVDPIEPEGGWTGKFTLISGRVESNPKCIVADGCVSSPGWPQRYPDNERCEIEVEEDTVLVTTHFEVAGDGGGVQNDHLMIKSKARRSSGVYEGSAGPYHVPLLAGDRLVWVADRWENAPGFRVCGYTPDINEELRTWPPECGALTTKSGCKQAECKWKRSKNTCKAKFECESLKKGRCKKLGDAKGCKWNKMEKVCQLKGSR